MMSTSCRKIIEIVSLVLKINSAYFDNVQLMLGNVISPMHTACHDLTSVVVSARSF